MSETRTVLFADGPLRDTTRALPRHLARYVIEQLPEPTVASYWNGEPGEPPEVDRFLYRIRTLIILGRRVRVGWCSGGDEPNADAVADVVLSDKAKEAGDE